MSNRRKAKPKPLTVIDVEGFDAVALDHAAADDNEWFDQHPEEFSRARPAWPVEVEALIPPGECRDVSHFGMRVHRVTRDRHAKVMCHAVDGRWEVVAVGSAMYPDGHLDRLTRDPP